MNGLKKKAESKMAVFKGSIKKTVVIPAYNFYSIFNAEDCLTLLRVHGVPPGPIYIKSDASKNWIINWEEK